MPARKPRRSTAATHRPAESLYPPGHPPFISGRLPMDEATAKVIQEVTQQTTLDWCLSSAYYSVCFSRMCLEKLRAELYCAEQLIETQPLPALDRFADLPQDIPVLLDTLNATRQCLEEWLKSNTCQAILATYPQWPARPQPPTGEEPS
jgi:hypothetical protein